MDASETQARSSTRRLWLRGLAAVIVLGGVGAASWYWLESRWYASTDNAYVDGNVVQITPQIAGTVVEISAENGDFVQQGQPLVRLDAADMEIAEQQAEAALASTVRRVRGLYDSVDSGRANVAAQKVQLQRARTDYERRKHLAETGAVSQEELQHARDALVSAETALSAAGSDLTRTRALVDDTVIASHPDVKAAIATLRQAYVNRARASLVAPVSGYVAMRSVQVGERVQPGTALMAVVPLEQLWVDANFKETQLRQVRIGQPVSLHSDFYGRDVSFQGRVESLGVGTGAAFSLLPAENATGNWIKIVQRLPVRIALEPEQLRNHPLRVGLSMTAEVDLHDDTGLSLNATPRQQAFLSTDVYSGRIVEADALAERIVHDNLPTQPGKG
jgi:membrane fusion protein (multidrug efflux system)